MHIVIFPDIPLLGGGGRWVSYEGVGSVGKLCLSCAETMGREIAQIVRVQKNIVFFLNCNKFRQIINY